MSSCAASYILTVGIASAAIYSVLVPISIATNLTVGDLNAGTGYMFLFFGWGCLVWQSLAQQYGKRPIYLLSLLATMVSSKSAVFSFESLETMLIRAVTVGHHVVGTVHHKQWPVDCEQDLARLLRGPD